MHNLLGDKSPENSKSSFFAFPEMETNKKHTSFAFFWNQKSPPPKKNLSHRLGDPNKKTTKKKKKVPFLP